MKGPNDSGAMESPEHWLKRAEKARAIAEGMRDPDAKKSMLDIADGYERLAKQAALMQGYKPRSDKDRQD